MRERPTEQDWAAGRAIDECVRRHPGPILMSRYQSYLVRAGRPVFDDFISAHDRALAGRWDPARTIRDIQEHKYVLILTDLRSEPEAVRRALEANYIPVGRLDLPRYVRRAPPLIVLEPRPRSGLP